MCDDNPCRKAVEAVAAAAGVNFWTLEEPTLWYAVGLLALQVVGREFFKRYGPFKSDAALFAHQVRTDLITLYFVSVGVHHDMIAFVR